MSLKKTLIFALILAGLLFYLFKYEMPAQKALESKDLAFKNFEVSKLESIEIRKEGSQFKLKNRGFGKKSENTVADDEWQIDGTEGAYVDPATLTALTTSLSTLKLDTTLPKEDVDGDLAVYGLKEPLLTVALKGNDLASEVLLGKSNQYMSKRYMKLSTDENVYMIDEAFFTSANKNREDFRDTTPVSFLDSEVKSVTVNQGKVTIKLNQTDKKDWIMSQPISSAASGPIVAAMFKNLRNLKAEKFIDDVKDYAPYKLDAPELKISLEFAENTKQPSQVITMARVNAEVGEKYYFSIAGRPSVFETKQNPFILLPAKADDFREKNLFNFASDEVNRAEVELEDGAKIIVVKDKENWKVNSKDGDKVFIDQWLSNLSETVADSFPAAATDYGFGKPKYKLSIELEGPLKRNLTIGSEFKDVSGAKKYYAAADDLNNPFIISEETFKKIALKEEALVPQKLAEQRPDAQAASNTPFAAAKP